MLMLMIKKSQIKLWIKIKRVVTGTNSKCVQEIIDSLRIKRQLQVKRAATNVAIRRSVKFLENAERRSVQILAIYLFLQWNNRAIQPPLVLNICLCLPEHKPYFQTFSTSTPPALLFQFYVEEFVQSIFSEGRSSKRQSEPSKLSLERSQRSKINDVDSMGWILSDLIPVALKARLAKHRRMPTDLKHLQILGYRIRDPWWILLLISRLHTAVKSHEKKRASSSLQSVQSCVQLFPPTERRSVRHVI